MSTAAVVLALLSGALPETGCVAAIRDIAAGEPLSAGLLERVVCRIEDRSAPRLRFAPASGSVTAAEALPAGTYLDRLSVSAQPVLPKGTRVTLRAMSGPAIVERQVTTLQSAKSGQRVFVRDDGGNVFAVALVVSDRESEAR